jgi:hypothetical protein
MKSVRSWGESKRTRAPRPQSGAARETLSLRRHFAYSGAGCAESFHIGDEHLDAPVGILPPIYGLRGIAMQKEQVEAAIP